MATVINNPGPERTIERTVIESDSSAGWVVAIIILFVVIAGGLFWWMRYRGAPAAPAQPANINVTVPMPSGGNSSSGNSGGTQNPAQ